MGGDRRRSRRRNQGQLPSLGCEGQPGARCPVVAESDVVNKSGISKASSTPSQHSILPHHFSQPSQHTILAHPPSTPPWRTILAHPLLPNGPLFRDLGSYRDLFSNLGPYQVFISLKRFFSSSICQFERGKYKKSYIHLIRSQIIFSEIVLVYKTLNK